MVPYEGFFEIVLCANKRQLDTTQKTLNRTFRKAAKVKRCGGMLYSIGHDSDRTEAAKVYISEILRIAGPDAEKFMRLVAHNVPAEVFSELASEKRS